MAARDGCLWLYHSGYNLPADRRAHAARCRAGLKEAFGQGFPFQEIYALRQSYYDESLKNNGVPVKAGLYEVLEFLAQHGIPRAVASSTHRQFALVKLEGAGITGQFQAVVGGDEVQNGKPAPDLFLEAARRFNVPPEECVVLEDLEAGIRAAFAAGMLPIMIPDLKQPSPDVAILSYRILPSLIDVIPLFQEWKLNGLPEFAPRV